MTADKTTRRVRVFHLIRPSVVHSTNPPIQHDFSMTFALHEMRQSKTLIFRARINQSEKARPMHGQPIPLVTGMDMDNKNQNPHPSLLTLPCTHTTAYSAIDYYNSEGRVSRMSCAREKKGRLDIEFDGCGRQLGHACNGVRSESTRLRWS